MSVPDALPGDVGFTNVVSMMVQPSPLKPRDPSKCERKRCALILRQTCLQVPAVNAKCLVSLSGLLTIIKKDTHPMADNKGPLETKSPPVDRILPFCTRVG